MDWIDEIEKEYNDSNISDLQSLTRIPSLVAEVRRLREENGKLNKALDNNIKCSDKTDTELFQANLKMAEMSIEVKRLQKKLHPTVDREWEDLIKDTYEGRGGDDGKQTKPI